MDLCQTCSKVDFGTFRTAHAESRDPPSLAWFLQDIKGSINCPFCRLMLKILSRDLEIRKLERGVITASCEALASYKIRSGATENTEPSEEITIRRFWLNLHAQGASGSLTQIRAGTIYGYGIQLLADENESEESQLLKGRLVSQTRVDVELIKMWIRTCENGHGVMCAPASSSTVHSSNRVPFTLRVIDIQHRCVIEAPRGCRYIALSYTWGTPDVIQLKLTSNSQARLFAVGGLSDLHTDIPTTIRDAMTLCSILEERYLWVDALCIKQDEKTDVSAQLANMDIIYSAAFITVVSGTGHDSWAGLPGVLPTSRNITQYTESVRGLKLVSTQMPFVPAMNQSGWNGRAWTFQERIISKRLLIFTKYQAFFHCNEELWWEDTILESKRAVDVKWRHMQDASQQHHYRTNNTDGYTQYMRLIEGYSSRALTHEEDALKALTGVLASLTSSHGIPFYEGIPESYLDAALLFHTYIHDPSWRRKAFPSWSWAGWRRRSEYQGSDIHIISEVGWYKYFSNMEMAWYHEIDNWKIKKANGSDGFELLRSLWKPANPAIRTRPEPPPPNIYNIPMLVFQTSVAFLVVDLTGKATESSFGNELCNIRCPNDKDRVIGQIRIHNQWRPERGNSILEFVVIARAVSKNKGQETTGLWTMLVETGENGLSERVQIPTSTIKDVDWAEAEPSWRTVYLA
jgi:Heterokaryon incompatibility protein (HET)